MTTTPAFSTEQVQENERIVIEPAAWHWAGVPSHREKIAELEGIKQDIFRHVDGTSRHNTGIHWDDTTVCTHCKEPVEGGCIDGVPHCCDEAQAEWVASGGVIPD